MDNLLFIILLTSVLFYIYRYNKENLNNTRNFELDKKIRNIDNENKIIKEISEVKKDKIENKNLDLNIKFHPYPDSSQNFIYVAGVNESLLKSNYIDDAYNLMIGELRQNITNDQFKNIQGKIKNQNVQKKKKLFNPSFYRFGQHYYNFKNLDNHIIRPNYQINANYL